MRRLTVPINDQEVRALRIGEPVLLNGVIVTGRDAAHKFMVERLIRQGPPPEESDLYEELRRLLDGGVIYHCGPVVRRSEEGVWSFAAAGPTTSIREEIYEPDVIAHFNLKGVIGKGGMGARTLEACRTQPAVYLHAIGGAASLIAQSVEEVVGVHKMEFGVPEAMWIIRVRDLPVVVTMDSHGNSLHDNVEMASESRLKELLSA